MFDIQAYEILLFLRQIGLGVASAATLWGIFLIIFLRQHEVAKKLLWVFFTALFFFSAAFLALAINLCAFCADAHEGISLVNKIPEIKLAMREHLFIVLALFILSAVKLLTKLPNLLVFFGVQFVLINFLMLYPWGEQESMRHAIFTSLHTWHSMLTIGTVFVVDFLFTVLDHRFIPLLRKVLPVMTMAIFLGLGVDFLSVGLIFNESFAVTEKFLFTQTLVGLIIINGTLLSGPILRAALKFREAMKTNVLSVTLNRITGISGSISIIGWLSITALDGFRSLTLTYWQLFLIYITLVGAAYFSRVLVERARNRLISP